jgi:uncharacterized protein YndB with AHSA1/START domain
MTDREIGRRRIAAGEARTAVLRRRYQAEVQDVWDACTDPERINRWLLPVTGDLRAGGTYRLEGNAHGEILRCEPPHLLAVTWVYGDRPADEVELRLSSGADGGTLLELEHASVCETAPDGVSDAIFGVGLGWEPALYALDLYLRGELPDALATEWRHGEPPQEVVDLMTRSGRAWAALVEAARRG